MKIFDDAVKLLNNNKYDELIKLIKQYPCLLFKMDGNGLYLLHYCLQHENTPLMFFKNLKTFNINFNQKTKYGRTPLSFAKQYCNDKIINFLESVGSKMNDMEFIIYEFQNRLEEDYNDIKLLIEKHKEYIYFRDEEGFTLLHHAVLSDIYEIAYWLIEKQADLNAISYTNRSVLGCSKITITEDQELQYYLISKGAKYTELEQLTELIKKNDKNIYSFLDEHYYLLHSSPYYFGSLLQAATVWNYVNFVSYLLDRGVYIDATDNEGQVALHKAYESKKITKILLKNGADINAKDQDSNTPLHCAIRHDGENINVLLEAGANINAVNKAGDTPLDIINEFQFPGYKKLAKEFIKRGAVSKVKQDSLEWDELEDYM